MFTQNYSLAGCNAAWHLSLFFVKLGLISASRIYKSGTMKPGVHNHNLYFLKMTSISSTEQERGLQFANSEGWTSFKGALFHASFSSNKLTRFLCCETLYRNLLNIKHLALFTLQFAGVQSSSFCLFWAHCCAVAAYPGSQD